jgi:hypothetical protein
MLSTLLKNNIIITPEWILNKEMYIQVNRQGTILKGSKRFTNQKEMQRAWQTAIKYEFERLLKNK